MSRSCPRSSFPHPCPPPPPVRNHRSLLMQNWSVAQTSADTSWLRLCSAIQQKLFSPSGHLGTPAATQNRKPWKDTIRVVCAQYAIPSFSWPRIVSAHFGAVGPGEKKKKDAFRGRSPWPMLRSLDSLWSCFYGQGASKAWWN